MPGPMTAASTSRQRRRRESRDPRFGNGLRDACHRRRGRGDPHLARARAKRTVRGEDRGAGHLVGPRDDQDPSARLLVAVCVRLRQRPPAQERSRDAARRAHVQDFGAAGTSGATVTGVPASTSGADEIREAQCKPASVAESRVEFVQRHAAIRHVGLAVELEDLALGHPLEEIAEAIDDDLVRDDQHACAACSRASWCR